MKSEIRKLHADVSERDEAIGQLNSKIRTLEWQLSVATGENRDDDT